MDIDTDQNRNTEYRMDSNSGIKKRLALWLIAFFALCFMFCVYILQAPTDFPVKQLIEVQNGVTTTTLSNDFANVKIVKSSRLLKYLILITSHNKGAIAGDYYFVKPLSVWDIALRISRGEFDVPYAKVTFPEGSTTFQMSVTASLALPQFQTQKFLSLATPLEGYLFPDTYKFLPNAKAETVVQFARDNFDKKIATIKGDILSSGRTLKDTIVMASIVEAEGRSSESRKVIAGILWKRLILGIPLQVDSPFQYLHNIHTDTLQKSELLIDSPYNTYKYKGLPPTPIDNPGMDSILATLHPTNTQYLYFLSGTDGNMHYATTFADHLKNKMLYLK